MKCSFDELSVNGYVYIMIPELCDPCHERPPLYTTASYEDMVIV